MSLEQEENVTRVSILGDSISTFEDCHPPGYKVYYEGSAKAKYSLFTAEKTWWGQVITALGARLCVNNSYSGSRVCGTDYYCGCSKARTSGLHSHYGSPDVILIYMGCNDFGFGEEPEQSGGDERCAFRPAYTRMLRLIKENYPAAKVVCGTLMRPCIRFRPEWTLPRNALGYALGDYNNIIREVCEQQGCLLADLERAFPGMRYETLDGTHPDVVGHRTMAKAWLCSLARLDFELLDY